jgi:hypothetical protein
MDRKGFTPAHLAAQTGEWAILERLLDAGFDMDSRVGVAGPVQSWASPVTGSALPPADALLLGATCLHVAAMNDDVTLVRSLLSYTPAAGLEVSTKGGNPPLALAAMAGAEGAAVALLAAGANAKYANSNGERIVHHCVHGGSSALLQQLHRAGTLDLDGSQVREVTFSLFLKPAACLRPCTGSGVMAGHNLLMLCVMTCHDLISCQQFLEA